MPSAFKVQTGDALIGSVVGISDGTLTIGLTRVGSTVTGNDVSTVGIVTGTEAPPEMIGVASTEDKRLSTGDTISPTIEVGESGIDADAEPSTGPAETTAQT